MFRFAKFAALGTLALCTVVASARAQEPGLREQLQQYGFELKEEGGSRVVEVTLQQVLHLALQRNLAIRSVRVGEDIANSALRAAQERNNPSLTSELGYARAQRPSASTTVGSQIAVAGTDGLTLSTEFTKPTDTGIEYSLSYTEERLRALSTSVPIDGGASSDLAIGDWISASTLTGAVTIPFGKDAGREYNNLVVRTAETGVTGSRLTVRQRELELVESTALIYWDLVAALENVRVQEEAVKLSEQLLQDNQQRLQAGVLSPFDVQVTETQLAREREQLITAKATVLRIEDLARALLNLQTIDFEVRPLDRPDVHTVDQNHTALLERLYGNHPDVKQVENELIANGLALATAQNDDRTDLDLELYYSMQGVNSSAFGGTGGFSDTKTNSYGAALTWTLPLFDTTTQETIRQRTLERQQLELQLESLKSDLNVRLQGVLRQIRVAREQVETASIARRLAEEQLNNEIERFRVGESTSFQVSQAQQDASQARVQEILARLGFERNFLQLLVLTGDIYTHYGIQPTVQ